MAKYKGIGGTTVQTRSGTEEYTYPSGAEGSIYYNSANGQFQFVGTATGAWSTGGTMNTGRTSSTGTGSSSSAHIIAGGYYLPPSVDRSATETYNGTAWTEVADCPADLTYGNGKFIHGKGEMNYYYKNGEISPKTKEKIESDPDYKRYFNYLDQV